MYHITNINAEIIASFSTEVERDDAFDKMRASGQQVGWLNDEMIMYGIYGHQIYGPYSEDSLDARVASGTTYADRIVSIPSRLEGDLHNWSANYENRFRSEEEWEDYDVSEELYQYI